jgi:hypothetical protein
MFSIGGGFAFVAMGQSDSQKQEERGFRAMTPAHVREPPATDYVEVVFLESARFYKLFKKNPAFNQIVNLLRDAMNENHTVQIRCTSPHGDVIEEVER